MDTVTQQVHDVWSAQVEREIWMRFMVFCYRNTYPIREAAG